MTTESAATGVGANLGGTRRRDYFPLLVSERLDIALCRASAKVSRAAGKHATEQGLGVGQHLVLKMLAAVGPCRQQDLSEELRIDRSVMVGCVDSLEDAGFVRRERNARDRRAYAVTITDAGRETLSDAEREVPGFLDETFGPLSRAERETLGGLLRKVLGIPTGG